MGSGDKHHDLGRLRAELGLEKYLELPGRVPDSFVAAVLSTADVGLCPDPKNPLNDVSTMNKTMEYMAYSLPVVAFDLRETRVSALAAARYVEPNDVESHRGPSWLCWTIRRPGRPWDRSVGTGSRASSRWEHQEREYLRVYDELVGSNVGRKG